MQFRPSETLEKRKTRVNGRLGNLWALLVERQEQHFLAVGRYFQGVMTHQTEPEATDEAPDRLDDMPIEREGVPVVSWRQFAPELAGIKTPMALRIGTYGAPGGWDGWWAEVRFRVRGQLYSRAKGYGPKAAEFTHAWRLVEDAEP